MLEAIGEIVIYIAAAVWEIASVAYQSDRYLR